MTQYWINVDKPTGKQVLHEDGACWDVEHVKGTGPFKPIGRGQNGGWNPYESISAAVAASQAALPKLKPLIYCDNCQKKSGSFQQLARAANPDVGLATAQLLGLLERGHVIEALRRIDGGHPNAFAESTRYDLLHKGKRYPPKRVAGLALEVMTQQVFGPHAFKGGKESVCFNALKRAGFTIAPKDQILSGSLVADIQKVLQLQALYSSSNTDAMKERGLLIRTAIPERIRQRLGLVEPIFSEGGYAVEVEGSDGVGQKVESAWIRVFDPEMSPSATRGWYVVLHFSRNGKDFYATLGCGATTFKNGSLVDIPAAQLVERVRWAKSLPSSDFEGPAFSDAIDLQGNALSKQFERATAYARRFDGSSFQEPDFWNGVLALSKRLVQIYDAQRKGVDPSSQGQELAALEQSVELAISPNFSGRGGQGRGLTTAERVAVERRAMDVALQGLKEAGFADIRDVSRTESCDFQATRDGGVWLVEVKGTTGPSSGQFLLTASELTLHKVNKGQTALAIVCDVQLSRGADGIKATGGRLHLAIPWNPDEWTFEPTAFKATKIPP